MKINDVTLEITRKCPLKCSICSTSAGEEDPELLNLSELIQIINEFIELGAKSFSISGGEPFNSSYLKDIIRFLKAKNVFVEIYSSGNVGTTENIETISKNRLFELHQIGVDKIIYDIHGLKEKHDLQSGVKGSFNNLLESISNTVNSNIRCEVNFVPTKLNYLDFNDMYDFILSRGVEQINMLRFVPQGRGKQSEKELLLTNIEYNRLKDDVLNKRDKIRIGAHFYSVFGEADNRCTIDSGKVCVRPDGRLFPCVGLKYLIETENDDNNLHERSVKDVIANSSIFKKYRSNRFTNLGCNEICLAQQLVHNSK